MCIINVMRKWIIPSISCTPYTIMYLLSSSREIQTKARSEPLSGNAVDEIPPTTSMAIIPKSCSARMFPAPVSDGLTFVAFGVKLHLLTVPSPLLGSR